MAPGSKSLYRGPDVQHFQVVNRPTRDVASHDPEASQRVLKSVQRSNTRKGENTLASLDATYKNKVRDNEGEAALYGITYDDSSYDYMSHLRTVGEGEAVDSFLIPAPRGSGIASGMKSYKGKGKAKAEDLFGPMDGASSRNQVVLPPEVLPSTREMSYAEAQARLRDIPEEISGFQPDMDPHLRQVLDALSDDEFVDDGDEDEEGDFFAELVKGGERSYPDEVEFEFEEWGIDDEGNRKAAPAGDDFWAHVKDFQRQKKTERSAPESIPDHDDLDPEERSEMADTVGSLNPALRDMIVRGGKKRRGKRGPSDASGMSMSSSSMFRNEGLRDLDDRFDQRERVIAQLLAEDGEDYGETFDEDYNDNFTDDGTASIAPSMMSNMSFMSRASMSSSAFGGSDQDEISQEALLAHAVDFLENFEVIGKKVKPSLGNNFLSGPEKLAVLRAAVDGEGGEGLGKEENKRRILELERLERSVALPGRNKGARLEKMERIKREEDEGEKWDVESILSTYTNTDNHPGKIRARSAAEEKKRALARAAAAQAAAEAAAAPSAGSADDSDDSGSETEREGPRITVTRPKGETAAERKARKTAVKAQRQARRVEKKSHQETFDNERKRQIKSQTKLVSGGRAADLNIVSRQVMSLS